MKFVGIDLATAPRDCGVCVLEDDTIAHVGRGTTNAEHPEWLADYCTGADAVGIDVPFGWPVPFAEALAGYEVGVSLELPRERYRLRTTDLWVKDNFPPLQPKSVSTDKLGSTAIVGTVLLSQLVDEFWISPRKSNVSKSVVEVYPAASLWAWRMPHDRYKTGQNARNIRVTIVDKLAYTLHIAGEHRSRLVASDHSLDALVAALTAREYAYGNTLDPPAHVPHDTLRTEGWIRVPKGKIGRSETNPLQEAALNREESWELMCEWTESDSLRKHMLAVEAAMRAYARNFGEDEEKWGITGLLHDIDYEKHPTPDEHPMVGVRELEKKGYPEDVLEAIKGHADYLDVPRESLLAKTLYAVDELSGFVVACALVRPEGLEGLKAKSVRKKMKQKSFAASVSREDIARGTEELGVDLNEHIDFVVAALRERADVLGLASR